MSPRQGERIATTEFDSPIGEIRIASTEKGVAWLSLPRSSGRGFAGWMARHAPGAFVESDHAVNRGFIAELLEYLDGKRRCFDLELDLRATPFQLQVFREIEKIPYGESRSYAEIASALGRPGATRAVGAASSANPLPLLLPCHRVIGSSGKLQGYAGSVELKARLLAMERGRQPGWLL